jgi:hypothetical protein
MRSASLTVLRLLTHLFVARAFVPSGAHLAGLPNKMALSPAEYMVVQRIYRGWALFGTVVFGRSPASPGRRPSSRADSANGRGAPRPGPRA